MPYSSQAAVTIHHGLRGLNNIDFLIFLEAGKSEIKVPADSVLGKDLFPGS
jgi:hypothetical protein